ncbi:MAG: bifunctional aldolase/short-chain dehydrogenase, partial [Myxococcota bacterium]
LPRMQSRFQPADAQAALDLYAAAHGEAVALRIYTSRLIGADSALVLHGGGNTSVKDHFENLVGDRVEAIFVKGSGWGLETLEPEGLPGLDLAYLRRLRSVEAMSDEEMVNQLRTHLFDASAPNPSVETLLHAFLPHLFVDHSHADAVLALSNQPDGQEMAREALGEEIIHLPYIMPGFPLALAVADAFEAQPDAKGILLHKHGLFTFADDARESYELHIEYVDRCETYLKEKIGGKAILSPSYRVDDSPETLVVRAAPILRGLLAERGDAPHTATRRMIMDWRAGPEVMDFCNAGEAAALCEQGPLTPDHVIRTKMRPVYLPEPQWSDIGALGAQLASAIGQYRTEYEHYFQRQCSLKEITRTQLDSAPRVVLMPGAGALCFGWTRKDARIAADITEHTLATKALAQAAGRYQSLSEADLFDMEYWSLEQAKLGKSKSRALEGQVVLITGGAGAIGIGVGDACAAAGAVVVLADLDGDRAEAAAEALEKQHGSGTVLGLSMDVTQESSVRNGFDAVCRRLGGLDVVVPNAGVAHVAPIEELTAEQVRRVSDVNYVGVLLAIREAARIFRLQATGGNVIVNASKNVFAPGAEFGAYSASKAAAHQIGKVAAMELGPIGVRVNLINADAIFGEGDTRSGLWQTVGPDRARSRGIDIDQLPDFYQERNLLKTQVTGHHVGNAVVFFASNLTPTSGATLPVDGGIAAAFPR